MNDDVEIWLLFAPFWLLGIIATLVALWHLMHFIAVHGKAMANGQAPAPFRVRNWDQFPVASRHHLKRASYAALTLVGVTALGMAVVAAWVLWRS